MALPKIKNIHIIINPAAGKRSSILPILNDAMKEAGMEWEVSITKKAGDGARLAKEAVQQGVDAVGVFGGDGTVMEVINGLTGSKIPLAILPGGTANVTATGLEIPKDPRAACQLICDGHAEFKMVDIGQFNKRHFIVGVSMGFEAEMIKGTDREAKNRFGVLAYAVSGIAALRRLKEVQYHLNIDGQEYKVKGLTCLVSNMANLGITNIPLEKHIDASDGFLDVLVLRKANFNLFKHILITLLKRKPPENLELVQHWQGKDISVSSHPAQRVQCDGESLERIPIHAKVIPSAVKILIPEKTYAKRV